MLSSCQFKKAHILTRLESLLSLSIKCIRDWFLLLVPSCLSPSMELFLLKLAKLCCHPKLTSVPSSATTGGHSLFYVWLIPSLKNGFGGCFCPKYSFIFIQTIQSTYYRSHMTNISYLLFHLALFSRYVGFWRAVPLVGTFFSVGRSMSHIKTKYGIISSIVTHYGISLGGFALYIYLKLTTDIFK